MMIENMTIRTMLIAMIIMVSVSVANAKDGHCGLADTHLHDKNRISVFVYLDQNQYHLDSNIVIRASVVNESDVPVYVYNWISWGYGGGFIIKIQDAQGDEVQTILRDDTMLPPPKEVDNSNIFVKLRDKGDFFGTRRSMKVADLVSRPGQYTMQVEYWSPLSCRIVSDKLRQMPALWHQDPGVSSAPVSFRVVPE